MLKLCARTNRRRISIKDIDTCYLEFISTIIMICKVSQGHLGNRRNYFCIVRMECLEYINKIIFLTNFTRSHTTYLRANWSCIAIFSDFLPKTVMEPKGEFTLCMYRDMKDEIKRMRGCKS